MQARRRQNAISDVVLPKLAEAKPIVLRDQRMGMIKEGVRGSKKELDEEYRKRFKAAVRIFILSFIRRTLTMPFAFRWRGDVKRS